MNSSLFGGGFIVSDQLAKEIIDTKRKSKEEAAKEEAAKEELTMIGKIALQKLNNKINGS